MEYIFGYPIWEFKKSSNFDREKITQEIYTIQDCDTEDKTKLINSSRGGYQSNHYKTWRIVEGDDQYPLTLAYIRSHLESPKGLKFPHTIESCWSNINKEGDYNVPHHHGSEDTLAGVLFVTDAPGLHLINPRLASPFSDEKRSPEGNAGDIILFPKCILHWVEPSKSKEDRITVAFNIE
tara:strand:+ start:391 stop:930 length:540 start_codon:yes stop_codon:yes gene_type:complete